MVSTHYYMFKTGQLLFGPWIGIVARILNESHLGAKILAKNVIKKLLLGKCWFRCLVTGGWLWSRVRESQGGPSFTDTCLPQICVKPNLTLHQVKHKQTNKAGHHSQTPASSSRSASNLTLHLVKYNCNHSQTSAASFRSASNQI